jgi:hypothetical protein
MQIRITAIHPLDAWYEMRMEFDEIVGMAMPDQLHRQRTNGTD